MKAKGPSWFEVVGVVARMKFHGYDETAPLPNAYFSLDQVKRTTQVLFVRAGSQAKSLEKTVREIVASVDPAQPVFDVRTMQERVEETWATHRFSLFCSQFSHCSRSAWPRSAFMASLLTPRCDVCAKSASASHLAHNVFRFKT